MLRTICRHLVVLTALAALGLPTTATAASPKILFVGRADVAQDSTDTLVVAHLRSLGDQVAVADQASAYAQALSQICSYRLVVISSTIRSRDFLSRFRDVPVPLLTWKNDVLDDLRFTGRYKKHDFGEVDKEHYLRLVNATHPLAGNLPAGSLTLYDRDQPMGWGKPGLGAAIIATLPGQPEKAVIFGYERGAAMDDDFLAPARRVFFPLDNHSFGQLNANGLALFDAAHAWAIAGSRGCQSP